MSHDKWEDDKIEDLLGKVPKIHDQRSKEDVLNRLKEDGLFDDEPLSTNSQSTKPSRKFNWIPIAVSIAAVLLLAILIPSFMNSYSSDSAEKSAGVELSQSREAMDKQEMEISNSAIEEDASVLNTQGNDVRTAVYPEEAEGNTIFQLGLSSNDGDSVPITVLIPNDRIQQDFGDITPSGVELYNKYAPLFNESAIGFMEYHPYAGTISELGDQVVHTLPNDQPYDYGTASMMNYFASLVDTFSKYSYDEVALLDEEGNAFTFSEIGEPNAPIALKDESTQYNYFSYTQSDGIKYLAPNNREAYSTVEEAILAMKEETNDIYQSVILPNVEFEVNVQDQVVAVSFTEELDLESFDQVEAMQMIEGMLLTAANFDMAVRFENILQTEWQGFDFTAALPIPLGPNEISYWTVFQ